MSSCHFSNLGAVDTNKKLVKGPYNEDGPTDVAYISHYLQKTYEDFIIRCERGRSDAMTHAKIEEWEARKNSFIDVFDINALKFMYGDNE